MFDTFTLSPDSPWLYFLMVSVGLLIPMLLVRGLVARAVRRLTERRFPVFSNLLVRLVRQTNILLLMMLSAHLAARWYTLPQPFEKSLFQALFVALVLQTGLWASVFADQWFSHQAEKRHAKDPSSLTAFGLLSFLARLVIWIIAGLIILENLGFNISTLVAGLGIGGIAVALAVQNLLGDLLGSLSIILDKPFVVGDSIAVGDIFGTIERIGVKTTHIRAVSGEQVILTNSDLLGSRIRNFKRLFERRVLFTVGIVYDTPLELVEDLPGMLREIVQGEHPVRFDRAHLKTLGDSALIYEIVYFVQSPDYQLFMDIQQRVNLAILKRFKQSGVEIAFPTQTFVMKNVKPPAE